MKTLMLRVCYLGLAVSTMVASPGGKEETGTDSPEVLKILDVDADTPDFPPLAAPAEGDTNAPPAKPPIMVQEPTAPPNLKMSPALAEVVKLVQAGVGADVLMAYITHSTNIFNIDSDTIVYLNDLGVTNTVITALIHHDSSPWTAARKASATAVQPLPPGVAATAPVTNVYPPAAATTRTFQTVYPGDISSVVEPEDTNLPPAVAEAAPAAENVTVNHFYSSLAPYGSWVDVDGYGLCWRPTVAVADPYWRPYYNRGRWMWSDSGWYWYSDYSWGWAPFHYGRWCTYPSLGWIWVPGTVWAPSWVTWRYTDAYCGWAPLPPGCGWRSGIGLTWYGSGVSVGFGFGLGWNSWCYVPRAKFCDWNVSRHCLPEKGLRVVHKDAVSLNKFEARDGRIINKGIEPNSIARASRTKIPTMRIKDSPLPVNQRVKPERIEGSGESAALVRPKLPKNPPPAAAPALARGGGNRATPAPASSASPRPNTIAQPLAPRTGASQPPVREQGNAKRHESVTMPQNPIARAETPNRVVPAQSARPTQVAPQTAPPRQQAPQTAPPQRQAAPASNPVPRTGAVPNPVQRNPAPVVRNAPAQVQPARPPAAQPAPVRRGNSDMIRSYAEPQRTVPNAGQARAPQHGFRSGAPAQPVYRSHAPVAPQPAARPHFSPRTQVSRPSPSAPPPAARSAPAPAPGRSTGAPNSGGNGGFRTGAGSGGRR